MKTQKQITGSNGEQLAISFLKENGYEILETGYRFKRAEIDIICKKDNFLIFTEVKTRKSYKFGYPESAVTPRKQMLYSDAANDYIHQIQWKGELRYDIISILMKYGIVEEIHHIKDAFWFYE